MEAFLTHLLCHCTSSHRRLQKPSNCQLSSNQFYSTDVRWISAPELGPESRGSREAGESDVTVFGIEKNFLLSEILLPGKSHGQRSLVGCSPWGR